MTRLRCCRGFRGIAQRRAWLAGGLHRDDGALCSPARTVARRPERLLASALLAGAGSIVTGWKNALRGALALTCLKAAVPYFLLHFTATRHRALAALAARRMALFSPGDITLVDVSWRRISRRGEISRVTAVTAHRRGFDMRIVCYRRICNALLLAAIAQASHREEQQ